MPVQRFGRSPVRPQITAARVIRAAAVCLAALVLAPAPLAIGRTVSQPPDELTDAEFWEFFSSRSEEGGTFVSENFVSNEMSFQDVIPTLQRTLSPGGVYLGVGPEQNFTYIANLRPRLAVIFDIRRQNAMQHLMYKALFELSATRAEFIARLFSRPFAAADSDGAKALFDAVSLAPPSDSAFQANQRAIIARLTIDRGFALSPEDRASIARVHRVFFEAGPDVNYGFRPGMPGRSMYATYGMLQQATNTDGVQMGYLASEEHYQTIRDLQRRNLIIPVVADFAGPTAIRSVGDFVRSRGLTVTAFYVSNVEQYLFREFGAADRWFGNVSSLPTDTTSHFIRSVPRSGTSSATFVRMAVPGGVPSGSRLSYSISVVDSAGVRVFSLVMDSAGRPVSRVWTDSAGSAARGGTDTTGASQRALIATRDSLVRGLSPIGRIAPAGTRAPVVVSSTLASGVASVRETLEAFFAGRLDTYHSVVQMTKTSGWKENH
jgi:hypothetical protein